jgi:hypothetical protein
MRAAAAHNRTIVSCWTFQLFFVFTAIHAQNFCETRLWVEKKRNFVGSDHIEKEIEEKKIPPSTTLKHRPSAENATINIAWWKRRGKKKSKSIKQTKLNELKASHFAFIFFLLLFASISASGSGEEKKRQEKLLVSTRRNLHSLCNLAHSREAIFFLLWAFGRLRIIPQLFCGVGNLCRGIRPGEAYIKKAS